MLATHALRCSPPLRTGRTIRNCRRDGPRRSALILSFPIEAAGAKCCLRGADDHLDKIVPFAARIKAARRAMAEPSFFSYSASARATLSNGCESLLFARAYSVLFRPSGTWIGITFARRGR